MPFPYVQDSRVTANPDFTTSHTVGLPTIIDAGDLIVISFACLTNVTVTFPNEGVDWFEIFSRDQSNQTHLSIAYKIADGSEGGTNISVSTSGSSKSVHAVYSISDHNSSTNPPEASTGANGFGSNADPDSLTASWGADDNMFIVASGFDGTFPTGSIVWPTNYDDNRLSPYSGNNGARTLVATREWSSTATQDPSTWIIENMQDWVACTVVVQGGIEGSSSSSTSSSSRSSSSKSSSSTSCNNTDRTDDTYWEPTNPEFDQGYWDSTSNEWVSQSIFPTFFPHEVNIQDIGSWVNGYRPTFIKIYYTGGLPATIQFRLVDSNSQLIAISTFGYTSGDRVRVTFGSFDIDSIYMTNTWNDDVEFRIYLIEFCDDLSSSSSSSSSLSRSSSSSSATPGTITWGHHTGVAEDYDENFLTNWTIDDNATIAGSGDSETLTLNCITATSVSETWYLGAMEAVIEYDTYESGSGPVSTFQYKTGVTRVACEADTWHAYDEVSFTSLGWIKIKGVKS